MAGAFHKTMEFLGLADGEEYYDEEDFYVEEFQPQADKTETQVQPQVQPQAVAPREEEPKKMTEEFRAPVTPIKRSADPVANMHQITTVHPRSYNDAKIIGESFRDGIPVVMNVTDMSEADAKRLVDFAAGLVFGMHGSIERVTNKVFLLSPSFVEVLGDDSSMPELKANVFNQN